MQFCVTPIIALLKIAIIKFEAVGELFYFDILILYLPYLFEHRALWMMVFTLKNMLTMTWSFDFYFLRFWWFQNTSTDCFNAWFFDCTQKFMPHHQWRLYEASLVFFKILNNILAHLNVVLLLIIIQLSWHHFSTDFLCAQIFGDNLLDTIFMSIWLVIIQLTTAIDHLPCTFNIDLSLAYWRPPTPRNIFHYLTSLFETLVQLKDVYVTWCYLLYSCWSVYNWVFNNQTKNVSFIYCLVFIICSSVFIAKQSEKQL